jgi:hypothetical protein
MAGVPAAGTTAAGVAGLAEAGCAAPAFPADAADELASSSATRLLSSTNWSSRYRSRSVIGSGASTFVGAVFAGGLLALVSGFVSAFVSGVPSSARERHGIATMAINARNKTQERVNAFTNAAI